ncbi:hypothetical protein [Bacillus sp. 37MA]|uniref:hypothetical protein n=1 Tax=Bacillus sp. 37MA TaxID=1132442 RepID=UPI00039BFAA8|nr:hypothetical protein [Bacillus sp. 37MA]
MSKKIKGYSFLSLALLILAVFIEEIFFSLRTPSFVEKNFGIYEPWGHYTGGFRE